MFTVICRQHGVTIHPSVLSVCRAYADPNLRIAPDGHSGITIKIASEHALSKALREQRKVKLVAEGDEQWRYKIERHG